MHDKKKNTSSVTSEKCAHDVAHGSSSSSAASAAYGPTMCVCVRVCMCGKYAMLLSETKTKQAGVFGWPATKQEEDCDEKKKANQVKLENEVHIKGRTNVFRFLVFCRLKRKKEAFSLFLFSPVVAPSQKRAMGFLCDACKAA